MPLAGLVVNRTHPLAAPDLSVEQATAAAERLEAAAGEATGGDTDARTPTAGLLRLHADRARVVARESRLRQRFVAAHPQVPTVVVRALATDVHDLDGLRRVGALLAQAETSAS